MSKVIRLKEKLAGVALQKEHEEGKLMVTEEYIAELRALAKLQDAKKSAKEFAQILGNEGKDFPEPTPGEAEISRIADELEIEEE